MKILILGAGGIGGYYGTRLIDAGADVTFLVRPQRALNLQQHGLSIHSELGSSVKQIKTVTADSPSEAYDVVIVACKSYDLDAAIQSISPFITSQTVILPFLNGLAAYEKLDSKFGRKRVLGGVAILAVSLRPDGSIFHAGKDDSLTIGPRDAQQQAIAQELFSYFAKSSGNRNYSENIDQDLWDKWVFISCGAALTSLMRGSIGTIMKTNDGAMLMKQAIDECNAVAQKSGFPLADSVKQAMQARLLNLDSSWSASMARDIDQKIPRIECDDIVGDMIKRAHELHIDVPLLRIGFTHLQVYQAQQALLSP